MKLDIEMRPFRRAARDEDPTQELLRAVRHALGVPVAEIARRLRMNRSVLFSLEQSEKRGTISLQSLERVANAMGCKVVYGIVPEDGTTMEEMVEKRFWEMVLGAAKKAPASATAARAVRGS